MSNLISISKKIRDVKSILKIAEALQLISSTKLKSYKDIKEKGRDYVEGLKFLFQKFYCSFEHDYKISNSKFVYIGEKGHKRAMWIVIGTDLSLCGRFNKQILDFLLKQFPKDGFLIVFGKKLFNLMKNTWLKNRIIKNYSSEIKVSELVLNLETTANLALKEFITRNCYHLNIIFQQFGKGIKNISLLPFTEDYFGEVKAQIKYSTHEYRMNPSECIIELFPAYLERTILETLLESKITEHGQRRDLMTNAVKSAEEKLAEYKLIYQKIRQSKITQEISEITSALKLNIGK
ncbi:F0F1 ATP synthase subunit gamma [Mycoplasma parvum]|uniref:ATP synthase gamma chain n=1 Tax=Mycoplasma parvum str. Indiana TaxID=1403316 RepID=U5NC74_9MOLU|nr:F0F1 ATP synthase subunit gamma [Mycoplasma parvum]AGX89017.1 hypothetical protein PRV_01275 [Mycoplasma parvum str. Indiana]